jgi:16S rRNA (cytosine1402-N4)-methyltransferase
MSHLPVLVKEVVEYLNAKKGGRFVDATAGSGGHVRAIHGSNFKNEVVGIDLDPSSLNIKLERAKLVSGNYKNIDQILVNVGWEKVDGILLDLGFSSVQLDDAARGFSFSLQGPLDMRFDQTAVKTAEAVINRYHPKDLERVIADFGEEKFTRRITAKIVEERKKNPITTTQQLAEIIKSAIPLPLRFRANDNIRRVFQAIRIEVNSELDNLKTALPKMLALLNPNGRLVVISFHSLEDRIVKEFFNTASKGCICPPEFPTCVCGKAASARVLTRKPIMASEEELEINSRSKPAKLRATEKI